MELVKMSDRMKFKDSQYVTRMIPLTLMGLTTTDYPFLTFYDDNYKDVDNYSYNKYGDILMEVPGPAINHYTDIIKACIVSNQEKYKHLFAIIDLEYNPIDNYNGSETITDVYGARASEDTIGETTTTTNSAAKTFTTKEYANGYNDPDGSATDYADKAKSESISPAFQDSATNNGHTDSHTAETYTDTHTTVKSGNLGVTSTQQMMTQEEEYWKRFNATMIMVKDIVDMFSVNIYAESDIEI